MKFTSSDCIRSAIIIDRKNHSPSEALKGYIYIKNEGLNIEIRIKKDYFFDYICDGFVKGRLRKYKKNK